MNFFSKEVKNRIQGSFFFPITLVSLFCILLFNPSSSYTLMWPFAAYRLLLLIFMVLFVVSRVRSNEFLLKQLPVGWISIGGGILLWISVCSVLGRNWRISLTHLPEYFLLVFASVIAFSEFSNSKKSKSVDHFGILLSSVSAIFILVSLYQWLNELLIPMMQQINYVKGLNDGYARGLNLESLRNTFPLGHSNYVAGLLVLVFPWIVQTVINSRSSIRHFFVIILTLAVLALFLTASRAAVISFALFFSYYGWIFICRFLKSRRSRFFALLSLSVFIAVAAVSNPRVQHSIVQMFGEKALTESDSQRSLFYQTGVEVFNENKLYGVGAGMVYDAYPDFCPNVLNGIFIVKQLHSTPLQLMVEFGLIGLFLFLVWSLYPLIRYFKYQSLFKLGWGSAAALSTFGYFIFSLFDYQLDFEVFPILVGINLGCLIALSSRSYATGNSAGKIFQWSVYIVSMLTITLVGFCIPDLWSRFYWNKAVNAYYQKDFSGYIESTKNAISWNENDPYYQLDLAFRLKVEGNQYPELSSKLIEDVPSLVEVFELIPNHEILLTNLGWLTLKENPEEAETYFRSAIHYAEGKSYLYVGLALCKNSEGNRSDAVKLLAIEAMYNPIFLTDGIWSKPNMKLLKVDVLRQINDWLMGADETLQLSKWGIWMDELITVFQTGTLPSPDSLQTISLRQLSQAINGGELDGDSKTLGCDLVSLWKTPSSYNIKREYLYEKKQPLVDDFLTPITNYLAQSEAFPIVDLLELNSEKLNIWYRLEKIGRPGYPYVMHHPDMPVPSDVVQIIRNGLAQDFFHHIFPAREQAPSAFILEKFDLIP